MHFNNASNEYHRDLVFDPPARMVGRFENFLRDAARDHAPCCGKGQRIVAPAIFKTFSKNHGIGTRTHAGEEWSQRGSNPPGSHEPLLYSCVIGVPGPGNHEPLLHRRCNRGSRGDRKGCPQTITESFTTLRCTAVIQGFYTGKNDAKFV